MNMRYIFILASCFWLSACDNKSMEESYFPLTKGMSWEYKVTTDKLTEKKVSTYSVTNQGRVELAGDYDDLPVYVRKNSDGTDYYIVQDDSGSHRIAKRTVVEYKPRFDREERKILPSTKDLDAGRVWSVETKPYILRAIASHSLADPGLKRFILTNEITATDATVTVPAGVFENCIEVTGQGELGMYVDPKLGHQNILITQKEWYARGVGLVKLERVEPLDLPMFKGGTITFELNRVNY